MGIRVLVCGGREYANALALDGTLDGIASMYGGISLVIHGGARGADYLAGRWAEKNGIPVSVYPADWDANGAAAGPIRNAKMLAESQPDLVVAMPGGRGTADMVAKAKRAGVNVMAQL